MGFNPPLTEMELSQYISECFGITIEDLRGKSRESKYIIPRQLFCWYCAKICGYKLIRIGRFLNRDHSTIMHSRDVFEHGIDKNDDLYLEAKIKFDHFLLNKDNGKRDRD